MKSRAKTRSRGLTVRKTELQGVLGKNQGFMCKNQKVLGAGVQKVRNRTAGSILGKLRGGPCKDLGRSANIFEHS